MTTRRKTRRKTRQTTRPGYVSLGGDTAGEFIIMAVLAFIFDGDTEGVALAREFCDAAGNHPPIDEMITQVQLESGRLLTA